MPARSSAFLAHLRLLEGVPFSYLVADAELIPPETIRFFYLDRNATDALVQGALSVGTVNSADRVQLAQLYGTVRNEVDTAERLVRMKDSDAPAVDASGRPIGAGGPISGFVLRSRLVSGWPGLHVRAYATDTHPDDQTIPDMDTSPDRVRLLRMERLAPAVLLVLFDGVPKVVHIEEPRSGVQFGVQVSGADPAQQTAVLPVRDVTKPNNGFLKVGGKIRTVPVPFRPGSPGRDQHEEAERDAGEHPGSAHAHPGAAGRIRHADAALPAAAGVRRHGEHPARDGRIRRHRRRSAQLTERFALAATVLEH